MTGKKVVLVCSKKGCPRAKKIKFDETTMPKNTVTIKSNCPWHESAGDFETEEYYNADGQQIQFDEHAATFCMNCGCPAIGGKQGCDCEA